MRSKAKIVFAGLLAVLAVDGSSCGLLGSKPNLNNLLNFNPQGVGCMNEIGAHFQSYFQGTMDVTTWGATWDCATSNLQMFNQFVQPSDPRGFTQGDILAFVSKFLITNKTISPDLINALFQLKASLFGGTSDIIAASELNAVVAFLGVIKAQTTNLLPNMVLRATVPSPDNLLALSTALLGVGDAVATSLNTQGNPTFSIAAAQTLASQLGSVLNVTISPDLVAWLNAVNVVLTAGSAAGVSAGDWPIIIRSIVSYGGPALAMFSVGSQYLTGPNAAGQFYLQLGWQIKTSLLQTFGLYGGALPLTALDSIIDSLPAAWFTLDRQAIKDAMRPIANKLLQSRVPNAIDSSALDLIFDKLQFWSDDQTALETIFANLNAGPLGVSLPAFTTAANAYALTLPLAARPPTYRMIALATETVPLFLANDPQITFTSNTNYSLTDLTLFNIFSMAAQHVVSVYSTVPGGLLGTVGDFETIVSDFTGLARATHSSDTSVPGWAAARFLEASLFTYVSRGDTTYIDIDEVMYLIAMAYSSGTMSVKIMQGTDAVCPSLGTDILGNNWKSAQCFQQELFSNYQIYWDHQPRLVQFYGQLSSSDQALLQASMEQAGRRCGVSDAPIASSDEQGFAGITQYVESLLARWDTNGDQHMDLNEANQAYPVFKGPLSVLGGLTTDPDFVIKSVFTYVLEYGHPPTKDFLGIASLVAWIAWTPFWSIDADRLKLYQVIGSIVVPEPVASCVPNASPTPSGMKPMIVQAPQSYTDLANFFGLSLTGGLSPVLTPVLPAAPIPVPLPSGP